MKQCITVTLAECKSVRENCPVVLFELDRFQQGVGNGPTGGMRECQSVSETVRLTASERVESTP